MKTKMADRERWEQPGNSEGSATERQRPRRAPIRWLFAFIGFFALLWFLVRVLPKPSRATYPCQRVAFPLASSFVIWLMGLVASMSAMRKAATCLRQSRYAMCAALVALAIGSVWVTLSLSDDTPAMADPAVANAPMGEAKGLYPGRVAWVCDPAVTDWDGGAGDGNWWFEHIDADIARHMVSRAIRSYAGIDDDAAAWDAMFRHFNRERGKGDVGYAAGEKITIKLNLVACFAQPGSGRVDASYNKTDAWKDNIDNAPDLVYGLLDQLVNVVGVAPSDIWVGDPTGLFPEYLYRLLQPSFSGVRFWDSRGTLGRTRAQYSDHPFYWSKPGLGTVRQDYVPVAYAEAEYVVNFAILKSHDAGGITVCGKNHYGSLIRLPPGDYRDDAGAWHAAPTNPRFYNYHDDLPSNQAVAGRYRNRVEFMGHSDIGGKTILYLMDGILAGRNWNGEPEPWTLPPFDKSGGWPCSLFASMDPVAIDSVALDFLLQQWPEHAGMAGTADYLVEAALADNPPSGTFYDPNHRGNVTRLSSLGVHERWNSPLDKQYSRNLDPENGTGIELLRVDDDHAVIARGDSPPVIDGEAEGVWRGTMWRLLPNLVDPVGGSRPATSDLSAAWKALWDESHLYFLAEVTDDVLVHSALHDDEYWCDDNVEIFIDADDNKGSGEPAPNYDGANDFHFGFRWGDPEVRVGRWSVPDTSGIVFSMSATEGGYRLEAAIPWSTLRARPKSLPGVAAGTRIGLDLHVTDNDEVGDFDPDFKLAWQSETDETFRDAATMATVHLSRDYGSGGHLMSRGSTWRYLKGLGEASQPTTLWRTLEFDGSDWSEGPAPFGYGDGPFGTTMDDMRNRYSSIFLRGRFQVPEAAGITSLWINADYDDAFAVWINARDVLRVNVPPGECHYDTLASAGHESGRYERFTLPAPYDFLAPGENLMAVQVFNVNLDSSDLKLDLELWFKAATAEVTERFVRGDSNGDGSLDVSDAIHMLLVLFTGNVSSDCDDARDVDDDGLLNITDPVALLSFLFRGGSRPLAPFPLPGRDPSPDSLACERGR